ncbi:MAG: hypothetical protein QXV27_07915 [Candidatus Caldarchaeum sp.]
MLTCGFPGLSTYAALAWALVSLGYGIGLALHRLPLPGGHGSSWGGHLISYALVSAGVLAVLGSANAFNTIVSMVQSSLGPIKWDPDIKSVEDIPKACESLPVVYQNLGAKAFLLLSTIVGIGMGAAIIPVVGPALANVFSVVASFPGLALSVTLITAYTLMVFLTVFGSLAVVLAPAGVALMAVPAGKLKGIGAWFIAAGITFVAAGPYIPQAGLLACSVGGTEQCTMADVTNFNDPVGDLFSFVNWLFDPNNNTIMKMWRFALGSLAGWGILLAASAALSKGIGGVAASLGFG